MEIIKMDEEPKTILLRDNGRGYRFDNGILISQTLEIDPVQSQLQAESQILIDKAEAHKSKKLRKQKIQNKFLIESQVEDNYFPILAVLQYKSISLNIFTFLLSQISLQSIYEDKQIFIILNIDNTEYKNIILYFCRSIQIVVVSAIYFYFYLVLFMEVRSPSEYEQKSSSNKNDMIRAFKNIPLSRYLNKVWCLNICCHNSQIHNIKKAIRNTLFALQLLSSCLQVLIYLNLRIQVQKIQNKIELQKYNQFQENQLGYDQIEASFLLFQTKIKCIEYCANIEIISYTYQLYIDSLACYKPFLDFISVCFCKICCLTFDFFMNLICKIHFQNFLRKIIQSRIFFEDQFFNIGAGYRMNEVLLNNELEIKNRQNQTENFLSGLNIQLSSSEQTKLLNCKICFNKLLNYDNKQNDLLIVIDCMNEQPNLRNQNIIELFQIEKIYHIDCIKKVLFLRHQCPFCRKEGLDNIQNSHNCCAIQCFN